jgi:hypothetical protein
MPSSSSENQESASTTAAAAAVVVVVIDPSSNIADLPRDHNNDANNHSSNSNDPIDRDASLVTLPPTMMTTIHSNNLEDDHDTTTTSHNNNNNNNNNIQSATAPNNTKYGNGRLRRFQTPTVDVNHNNHHSSNVQEPNNRDPMETETPPPPPLLPPIVEKQVDSVTLPPPPTYEDDWVVTSPVSSEHQSTTRVTNVSHISSSSSSSTGSSSNNDDDVEFVDDMAMVVPSVPSLNMAPTDEMMVQPPPPQPQPSSSSSSSSSSPLVSSLDHQDHSQHPREKKEENIDDDTKSVHTIIVSTTLEDDALTKSGPPTTSSTHQTVDPLSSFSNVHTPTIVGVSLPPTTATAATAAAAAATTMTPAARTTSSLLASSNIIAPVPPGPNVIVPSNLVGVSSSPTTVATPGLTPWPNNPSSNTIIPTIQSYPVVAAIPPCTASTALLPPSNETSLLTAHAGTAVAGAGAGAGAAAITNALPPRPPMVNPMAGSAARIAETILARTRSRADPHAPVTAMNNQIVTNNNNNNNINPLLSSSSVSSSLHKAQALETDGSSRHSRRVMRADGSSAGGMGGDDNDDDDDDHVLDRSYRNNSSPLLIHTRLARKRVRVAQLLVIGIVGILFGWLGNFFVTTSCHFVSIPIEVGNHEEPFLLHFGLWKYSPADSAFTGYNYCYPYSSNTHNDDAPIVERVLNIAALVAGTYSIGVLWIYLVSGKVVPWYWYYAIRLAVAAAILQLSTLLFFVNKLCRNAPERYGGGSCQAGPAAIFTIFTAVAWLVLAYELHYHAPYRVHEEDVADYGVDHGIGGSGSKKSLGHGDSLVRDAAGGVFDPHGAIMTDTLDYYPHPHDEEEAATHKSSSSSRGGGNGGNGGGYQPPSAHSIVPVVESPPTALMAGLEMSDWQDVSADYYERLSHGVVAGVATCATEAHFDDACAMTNVVHPPPATTTTTTTTIFNSTHVPSNTHIDNDFPSTDRYLRLD